MTNPTLPQDSQPKNNLPGNHEKVTNWREGEILLGTYEVKGIIAQGGMGIIYLVHHSGWGVDLAVKSPLINNNEDPTIIENYLRECETWIDLGLHPNIVTCYYVRNIGGLPRIFSEYIEGGSLKNWISNQRLYQRGKTESLETILDIAIQVAWGLNYAHQKNVIHQDVKPSNILINENSVAKITDFGVSRARRINSTQLTNKGTIYAQYGGMTPEYCSPEQANKALVSRKTDIWSWGVSVLEMFTGETTWVSGILAPSVLSQYLDDDRIPNHIPRMPNEISNLLSRCFQKEPENRPGSFELISSELIDLYNQITGHPYGRRNPENLKLLADSLNNRGVSLWDLGNIKEATESWDQAITQEPLHPQATYNKYLTQWRSGQITDQDVIRYLEAVVRDNPSNEMASVLLGDIHLERGDLQAAKKIYENISDGNIVQTLEERKTYIDKNIRKSRFHIRHLENSARVVDIAFVGNNQEAISVSGIKGSHGSSTKGCEVQFWNLDNGKCDRSFHIPEDISSACFGLKRNILVVGRMPSVRDIRERIFDDKIGVWDINKGQKIRPIDGYVSGVKAIDLGSDDSTILAGGYGSEAGLWDAITGKQLTQFHGISRIINCVRFTLDMKFCFTGDGDTHYDKPTQSVISIKMWQASDGRMVREFIGHTGGIESININHDNTLMVSCSNDRTIKVWDIPTGICKTTLSGHIGSIYSVAFLNNESYLISGGLDHTVRIWNIFDKRCIFTYEEHNQLADVVTTCKENEFVLSSGMDGINLWSSGQNLLPYQVPYALCYTRSTETQITAQENFETLLVEANEAFIRRDYSLCVTLIRKARDIPNQARSFQALEILQKLYQVGTPTKLISAWLVGNLSGYQAFYEVNQALGKKIALYHAAPGTCRVIDITTNSILGEMKSKKKNLGVVCISNDYNYAFSEEGGLESDLAIWNLSNGSCNRSFPTQEDGVLRSVFDHSNRYVITGNVKGVMKKWDIKRAKCVMEIPAHRTPINAIYTCKNPNRIITGSGYGFKTDKANENTIKVWDGDSGKIIHVFDAHTDSVNCFAVTREEDYLFSASNDTNIKMWDLRSGRAVRSFTGHMAEVTCLDITPNQKYLISGSQDRSIRIWDVQNGECVFVAKFDQPVWNVNIDLHGGFLYINADELFGRIFNNIYYKYFMDWDIVMN